MLSLVNYAYGNDLVTSTLGFTYYLLVTRVLISSETSNDIVHSHIKIALFISMILTIFVFPFFPFSSTVTNTGSLNIS